MVPLCIVELHPSRRFAAPRQGRRSRSPPRAALAAAQARAAAGAASAGARRWASRCRHSGVRPDAVAAVGDESDAAHRAPARRSGCSSRPSARRARRRARRRRAIRGGAAPCRARRPRSLSATTMSFTQPRALMLLPVERAGDELAVAFDEEPQRGIEFLVLRHEREPLSCAAPRRRSCPSPRSTRRAARGRVRRPHPRTCARRRPAGQSRLRQVAVELPPHAQDVAVVREAVPAHECGERLVLRRRP